MKVYAPGAERVNVGREADTGSRRNASLPASPRADNRNESDGAAMSNGWSESADAWIADMGDRGDFGRAFVLDRPMMQRVAMGRFVTALDVGCGEGRFCRMMAEAGIQAVGIDPVSAMVEQARRCHPEGDYRLASAERLPFPDRSFDLVVSYLTLIDITNVAAAIAEMARVLKPQGSLLVANLNGYVTAAMPSGWRRSTEGGAVYCFDNYLEERPEWVGWRGIRIKNWHRPFSTYMKLLLDQGLILTYFDEPAPHGGDEDKVARYRRAPYFHIMEWRKPGAGSEQPLGEARDHRPP